MDFSFLANLGDYVQMLPAVATFLTAHWETMAVVGATLTLVYKALKEQQYQALWPLALQLVREVAGKELSGVEKRKEVAKALYDVLPVYLKKFFSLDEMELFAEDAYTFLRGELKQEGK